MPRALVGPKLSLAIAQSMRQRYSTQQATWTQLKREHGIGDRMLANILHGTSWPDAPRTRLGDDWTPRRVSDLRESLGWTNRRMAIALGVTTRTVESWTQDRSLTSSRTPRGNTVAALRELECMIFGSTPRDDQ